jgi:hypothetical protein
MAWGKGNKILARTMFPQGIGFTRRKGTTSWGRRGGTSLGERGLSCCGKQYDLKNLIPNFSFCIIKNTRAFQYLHFESFHKECLIWTKFYPYIFLSNISKLAT